MGKYYTKVNSGELIDINFSSKTEADNYYKNSDTDSWWKAAVNENEQNSEHAFRCNYKGADFDSGIYICPKRATVTSIKFRGFRNGSTTYVQLNEIKFDRRINVDLISVWWMEKHGDQYLPHAIIHLEEPGYMDGYKFENLSHQIPIISANDTETELNRNNASHINIEIQSDELAGRSEIYSCYFKFTENLRFFYPVLYGISGIYDYRTGELSTRENKYYLVNITYDGFKYFTLTNADQSPCGQWI